MARHKKMLSVKSRPSLSRRHFTSDAVEGTINSVSAEIDDPVIARMFSQCYPNTLDTTVTYREDANGNPDTFVQTGDIPAMWLRDSTNQVWPYRMLIREDEKMQNLFIGLIRRQARNILIDPFANAFINGDDPKSLKKRWWKRGKGWKKEVWERKYELDSLCAFFRLSAGYYATVGDLSPYDATWVKAVRQSIKLIRHEQKTLNKETAKELYQFYGPTKEPHPAVRLRGFGYPGKECGLSRSVFRPSDDEAVFPYPIAANAMTVVTLRATAEILEKIRQVDLATSAADLANEIDSGIQHYGIVEHEKYGKIFAYEVDGFGSHCLMDDPNVPSLLSLPYIGYCRVDDPIYVATRKFILSDSNPFYAKGKVASGLTSPHTGVVDHFWPMATIMQALTSNDPEEISECLAILKRTHAGTYFMHESVHVDNSKKYTRPWFSWANSLFGELILYVAEKYPAVLKQS